MKTRTTLATLNKLIMRKINLNVDYGFEEDDKEVAEAQEKAKAELLAKDPNAKIPEMPKQERRSNQETTAGTIYYAIQQHFKGGIAPEKRRIFFRAKTAIDKAVKAKEDFVLLNEYEYLIIKEAFDMAVIPVEQTKYYSLGEEAVLNATSEKE